MNPIFLATVKNGKLCLENRDQFVSYLSRFEGKYIEITAKPRKKHRSNNQNRYYWGVCIEILADHTGYAPEEMHDALRLMFLLDRSKNIPTLRSTTDLTTTEFEEYMSNIRQWAASELSCNIPEPNEVEYEERQS